MTPPLSLPPQRAPGAGQAGPPGPPGATGPAGPPGSATDVPDEVWVGTDTPPDPLTELWWDEDGTGVGGIVSDSGWLPFPYFSTWTDWGLGWGVGRYRKIANKVRIEVAAVTPSGSGANSTIGNLPAGFRPPSGHPVMLPGNHSVSTSGSLVENQITAAVGGEIVVAKSLTAGSAQFVFGEFYTD